MWFTAALQLLKIKQLVCYFSLERLAGAGKRDWCSCATAVARIHGSSGDTQIKPGNPFLIMNHLFPPSNWLKFVLD